MINRIQLVDNQLQVNMEGSIYVEEATALRKSLLGYIDTGHVSFLIDFSQVDYIDSSGLGALVAIQKRALQHGGSITITGLQGLAKDLFELTRLNKMFEIQ